MKFFSREVRPETIPNETGSPEAPIYGIKYEENGVKTVIVKGFENRYEQAQLFKEQCDVKNIVARYTAGDELALAKAKTIYGDFTETPKTLMDTLNMVADARAAFEMLPKNIREAYNYDPDQMIRDIGSDKFNALFQNEVKVEEPIKEEVKASE